MSYHHAPKIVAFAALVAGTLLAAVASLAGGAPETPTDQRWRILLKDQLKSEKNCDLLEVLTYSELKVGDDIAISGKISCVDGREYDYNRQRPHQSFNLRLCEPTVC
jgi:hypothetical protein